MSEFTPTTEDIRAAWREVRPGRSWDEATAEFYRWIDAHNQGIRDALQPPAMTAREHMEAAWEAAHEVPEGRKLPAGTPYVCKRGPVEGRIRISFWPNGDRFENAYSDDVRTLDPLPPLIPDDCNLVWSGNPDHRSVWHRDPSNPDRWNGYDVAGHAANLHRDNLIDPKPVPTEES